jgi:hypothetical protein
MIGKRATSRNRSLPCSEAISLCIRGIKRSEAMILPGFNAEAAVYRTRGRYYTGGTYVFRSGGVSPAENFCPPKCVEVCESGCRADGLSPGACATLCNRDCSAYLSGEPLSCGPCVENVQTCIYCGGVRTTVGCDLPQCGGTLCSPGASCCGPHCCPPDCCPDDTICCSDGDGCCPDGSLCGDFLGAHFCIPFLGGLTAQRRQEFAHSPTSR